MPGIYGLLNRQTDGVQEATNKLFLSMGSILLHRKDYLHNTATARNLQIGKISFPTDPQWAPPLWNEDRSMLSVMDGTIFSYTSPSGIHEVYDNKEVLHILMDQYRRTGSIDCSNLNGEFNIAIYDISRNVLTIANDRWGFRELYYFKDRDLFLFAPEVKALLEYSHIDRRFDEQGIMDFLNYGYILANRTLLHAVSLLPPASVLVIDAKELTLQTRDFTFGVAQSGAQFNEHVDIAYHLLDNAVQRRLRGRNKIAATLSGGLDSRIIAALIAKNSFPLDAFSFGDQYSVDCKLARQASQRIHGCNNIRVKTEPELVTKYAEWMVWLCDGMVNLYFIPTFFGPIASSIWNHDILFGGFYGDVTLGGIYTREKDLKSEPTTDEKIELLKFRVGAGHLRPFEATLFPNKIAEKLNYYSTQSVLDEYAYVSRQTEAFSLQHDLFIFLTRSRRKYNVARGLLGHIAIEEYYPFFDDDFITFIYSIPPANRINHRLYFEIYKRYFPHLAEVPWSETGVSIYRQKSILIQLQRALFANLSWYLKRATLGRVHLRDNEDYAPHDYWYRTSPPFRDFINRLLLDPRTLDRGYFQKEGLISLFNHSRRGWDYFYILNRLCVFELWCRLFVDGDGKRYSHGYDPSSVLANLDSGSS